MIVCPMSFCCFRVKTNCPRHQFQLSCAFTGVPRLTPNHHILPRVALPIGGIDRGTGSCRFLNFYYFLKFIDIFSPGKQEFQREGKIYSSSHGQFTWYVRSTAEHHESMIFTPLQLKSVPIQRLMVST